MNKIAYEQLKRAFDEPLLAERRTISSPEYHRAAVLVPLVRSDNKFELLFTKRTETVETHKGQISFPGGVVDASDNDIVHTALREADEEIGIPRSCIEILGLLDDMATPTGFVVTPVVGVISELPTLNLNADEVAEVFRVELEFFAHPSNGRTERREFRGKSHEVWYYDCGEHVVWGATATIIRSLLKKLRMVEKRR